MHKNYLLPSRLQSLFTLQIILFFFMFFIFPQKGYGGIAAVDLSASLKITEDIIESGKVYSNVITITNERSTGDANIDANGAQIVYSLASVASYAGYDGTGWDCSSATSTVTCTYDNTLNNAQTSNPLTIKTTSGSSVGTETSSATVSFPGIDDDDPSNNSANDSVLVGKANLSVQKTATKSNLQLDETYSYIVTVSNASGPYVTSAQNVQLSDVLDSSLQYQSLSSVSPGWSCSGGSTVSCNGLLLDPGQSASVTINVKSPTSGGGTIVNTASVRSDSVDVNSYPVTDSESVSVEASDITPSISAPGTAPVESSLVYDLSVTNLGATPAENVKLSFPLSGLTYTGHSASDFTCSATASEVTCILSGDLAKSEVKNVTISTTTPSTHQTISKTVSASTSTAQSNTGNDTAEPTSTEIRGADLRVVKTQTNPGGVTSVDIGSDVTYTVTVYNDEIADAENVVVTDTLDSDMTYKSNTGGCSRSGQKLTCNLGTINAKSNKSFTVTATMPTDTTDNQTNSAAATTSTDQQNSSDLSDTATTQLRGPSLTVDKSASVNSIGLGGTFIYTVKVQSTNSADASSLVMTDTLPSGVTINSIASNPSGWSCGSFPKTSSFTCTLASLAGNASSTITFNTTAPASSTGTITNRARIGHELDANDDEDPASITVTGITLDVTKNASSTAQAGETISYTIVTENSSQTDASGLTLTDNFTALGSGYTLNSITDNGGWSCSGSTALNCTRASLAAGASTTLEFTVNVPADAALGTIKNTASVETTSPENKTFTSNQASTTIQGADLVVTKSGDYWLIANETGNFTVTVRNDGTATATNVQTVINLNSNNRADYTDIQIDCATGSYAGVTEPHTCDLGNIAGGASKLIHIRVTAPNYDTVYAGATIRSTATASTDTSQSDTNNDAKNWWNGVRGADLLVTKTPSQNEVAVNETVKYTITLTNQGYAVAKNITLTDSVVETTDPLSLSNLNYNSTDWSCSASFPNGFSCSYKNDLAGGSSTSTITIDATAPNTQAAIGQIKSNQVEVANDTAEKEYTTTNTNVSEVTIRGSELTIVKSVTPTTVELQGSATFTIAVTNSGLADAENVEVTDTLPTGFSALSTNGCDNDGSAVSGLSVTCQLGSLSSGSTKSFTITATAPNSNGDFENTASTTTTTPEGDTTNNSDRATLRVEGADLNMNKWDSADPVATNSYYYYYLGVENEGRSTAYGAEINDTITGHGWSYVGPLEMQNSDWSCTLTGSLLSCSTGITMASGYESGAIVRFLVQAPASPGMVYNTAVVGTDTSEAELNNNTETESTEVIDIDLMARKLVNGVDYGSDENYVGISDTITYEVQVRNRDIFSATPIDITDVNVTDQLPANLTATNITAGPRFSCSSTASTVSCVMQNGTTNPLQIGDGWVTAVTITGTAPDAASFDRANENNNLVINRYQATTTLGDQDLDNNAPGGNGFLQTNTLVRGANASLDKSGDTLIGANQELTYTLAIRNWPRPDTYSGSPDDRDVPSTDATSLVVTDILPTDTTFVSATGSGWSCSESGGVLTCQLSGDLAPSATSSDIAVTIEVGNVTDVTITNEANVTNDTPELDRLLTDNRDTFDTDITGTDIVVTQSGPTQVGMGDEIAYVITVDNNSTVDAEDIRLDNTMHSDVTVPADYNRDLPGGWSCSYTTGDTNISCSYASTLAAGSSTQFTLYLRAPDRTGEIRNRVQAFTSTAETNAPNIYDFDTTIVGAEIGFGTVPFEQSPNPVGALRPIDYNISVANSGLSDGSDINLTMQFPSGFATEFEVTSTGGGSWICSDLSPVLELLCNLPTLASGATSTLAVSAIAPNANQDVNYTITVVGGDSEGNTTSATQTAMTTVIGSDLLVKKYAQSVEEPGFDDINITAGMAKFVDFNITVDNRRLGLAKDINLTDTFDGNFSDLSIQSQTGWTSCVITGSSLLCEDNGMLDEDGINEIIIRAKTPSAEITLNNEAFVTGTTVETDTTNQQDSVSVKVEGSRIIADVNVSKTVLAFEESFEYLITLTNEGKTSAEDINLSDLLPTDMRYSGFSGTDWSCVPENNNSEVYCLLSSLAALGGESNLSITVTAPTSIGSYTNEITVATPSMADTLSALAPEVTVRGADLNVSIQSDETEIFGDRNVSYTLFIANNNLSTANDINITQSFSESMGEFIVMSDGGAECNITSGTLRCTLSALASDENITIVTRALAPSTGTDYSFNAILEAATVTEEEDSANNQATLTVNVEQIKAIAEWRMDACEWDGTAGEVIDSSSSGINGKARNGALTLNALDGTDDVNRSSFCRSGIFDGDNDSYLEIPNSTLINTGTYDKRTISLWFRADDPSLSTNQVLFEEGGGTRGLAIYLRSGKLYVGGWNRSSSEVYWSGTYLSTSGISANHWHHVALVLNALQDSEPGGDVVQSNAFHGYLDGVEFASGDGSQLWPHSGDNRIGFCASSRLDSGSCSNTYYFTGLIDEMKIFNQALDAQGIEEIYTREKEHINYDATSRTCNLCTIDVELTKTVLPEPIVGAEENLTYTLEIENLKAEPVTDGLTLSDTIPSQLTVSQINYNTDWAGCFFDENSSELDCTLADESRLDKGDTVSITVLATAPNEDSINITNSATVETNQTDGDLTNNTDDVTSEIWGTDLNISMTAPSSDPTAGEPFAYTILVQNASAYASARDITITDTYDSRLSYQSIAASGASCSNNLATHTVTCTLLELEMGESVELNLTVQSDYVYTNLSNEASVASVTVDHDLTNNSVGPIYVDINASAGTDNINKLREKTFRRSLVANKYGKIAVIGNTMLDSNWTSGNKLNEVNTTALTSSSADLKLVSVDTSDNEDNITIEYAALFWGGHVRGNDKNDDGTAVPFEEITFTTPIGNYPITAVRLDNDNPTQTDENRTGYYHFKYKTGNYRIFYGAVADVTEILRAVVTTQGGYADGIYTVSGMQATDGIDPYDWAPGIGSNWNLANFGHFGGWSLVVAYSIDHKSHRGISFKNLAVFDGFRVLLPKSVGQELEQNITIDGFITPVEDAIESTLFSMVMGSDRQLALEGAKVTDKNGTYHDLQESGYPNDNIFNDTITLINDSDSNYITRSPSPDYNPGIDLDQFDLSSSYNADGSCANTDGRPCYLSNEQNSTTQSLSVKTDTVLDAGEYPAEKAFVQMLSMETQIYNPDFIDTYKECFVEENNGSYTACSEAASIKRGDQLIYRITIVNTGDIYANHLKIVDPLPEELDFDLDESQIVATDIQYFDNNSSAVVEHVLTSNGKQDITDDLNATGRIPDSLNVYDTNDFDSFDISTATIENNRTQLTVDFTDALQSTNGLFPALTFAWFEFRATVNNNAGFNTTFANQAIINFTNPTLEAFGYTDANQTQESANAESPPVNFDFGQIESNVSDAPYGATVPRTVTTKVVNKPFDLNFSIDGNSTWAGFYPDVNITLVQVDILDAESNTTIHSYLINGSDFSYPVGTDGYQPISTGMSWIVTDRFVEASAHRNLYFDLTFNVKAEGLDLNGTFGHFGDHFAVRPEKFVFTPSSGSLGTASINATDYTVLKSGADNTLDVNATDSSGLGHVSGYTTYLFEAYPFPYTITEDNISGPACISGTLSDKIELGDLNFTDGSANTVNIAFEDVGLINVTLRDANWTAVDRLNSDCNTTDDDDNDHNNSNGLTSCYIKGEALFLFVPANLEVNTTINNAGAGFTYIANDLDTVHATVTTTIRALNADGNVTGAFESGCYGNDVNLSFDFNVTSDDNESLNLFYKRDTDTGSPSFFADIGTGSKSLLNLPIDDSNFTNGVATATYWIDLNRTITEEHLPVIIDTDRGRAGVINYLGSSYDIPEVNYLLNGDQNATFWYARVHAPDYRTENASIQTPIFVEVYCDSALATCADYGISGKESKDDINWWINTAHSASTPGKLSDINATQKGSPDPKISINGAGNQLIDINQTFSTGQYDATISYTGGTSDKRYKTKIYTNPESWLRYNRYFSDGRTYYHVEFDFADEDWSGIGQTGQVVETNGSTKTNRRIEW